MNRDVLSVLVRAGMDEGYAALISKDSVMRLWRLTPNYQLEIPLTCGSAWTAELSDREAARVRAAFERAGVAYLTEP